MKSFSLSETIDICPGCGHACSRLDEFCPECGTNLDEALEIKCPACGRFQVGTADTCVFCGAELSNSMPDATASLMTSSIDSSPSGKARKNYLALFVLFGAVAIAGIIIAYGFDFFTPSSHGKLIESSLPQPVPATGSTDISIIEIADQVFRIQTELQQQGVLDSYSGRYLYVQVRINEVRQDCSVQGVALEAPGRTYRPHSGNGWTTHFIATVTGIPCETAQRLNIGETIEFGATIAGFPRPCPTCQPNIEFATPTSLIVNPTPLPTPTPYVNCTQSSLEVGEQFQFAYGEEPLTIREVATVELPTSMYRDVVYLSNEEALVLMFPAQRGVRYTISTNEDKIQLLSPSLEVLVHANSPGIPASFTAQCDGTHFVVARYSSPYDEVSIRIDEMDQ